MMKIHQSWQVLEKDLPDHSSSSFSGNSSPQNYLQMDPVSNDMRGTELRYFKKFDAVIDYSDHHFAKETKGMNKPSNNWMKKIQQEWKVLEKDLPDTIFVRVYEERMDLLRAVIIGPAETPYHDGLFFFDFQFPANYPDSPPSAYYHSGGLRLNPNLYTNGKVCLSLLNTWYGRGCEKWDPQKSSMLQILVSIQALVLNAKPYFNEPALFWRAGSRQGEKKSLAYTQSAFLLSCKTMLYSLRRPPMHFKEFVAKHFCKHGNSVLLACRAYTNGTPVGCVIERDGEDSVEDSMVCSKDFKDKLKQLSEELLKELIEKGADCKEFLIKEAIIGDALGATVAITIDDKELIPQMMKAEDASSDAKRTNCLVNCLNECFSKLRKKVSPVGKKTL